MPTESPNIVKTHVRAPAAATGAASNIVAVRAPFAGTVSKVTYIADALLTGANTNTRAVSLVNKGVAGSGTTVVATKQFNSGVNATALVETDVTLSVVANATVVAAGDILQLQSAAIGTGLADPGGLLLVELTRDDSL